MEAKRKRYGAEEIIGKLRGTPAELAGRARGAGRALRQARTPELHALGQRAGARGAGGAAPARADRCTDALHRAGSPWENGYIESFNGRLRDEHLNGERFDTLLEAQVLIELWRNEYNQVRPHSSLRYRSPAPEVTVGEPVLDEESLTLQVV